MKLLWAVLFGLSDIAVACALVYLLCSREYQGSRSVEWIIQRRRRRRWYVLVTLAALAYVSLAPFYLYWLIRIVRG